MVGGGWGCGRVDDGLVEGSSLTVLQLRVFVREISPLIWRRVVIADDASLADLHSLLQVCFGWSDGHLHRFRIHGIEYGIWREGCAGYDKDARSVRLAELGLRVGERFVYEYDFGDWWVHDLRVEAIRPAGAGERLPCCVGGRRAGPPEDCGGPPGFMAWEDSHSLFELIDKARDLLAGVPVDVVFDDGERADLLAWVRRDRFDRREVNQQLDQLDSWEVPA